ncbi:MAG TPA: Uma2 family endonuclease [Pirellulales bacterium]|nr:Uma2 family endonuclease [Pirellulales bacterium]
MSTTADYGVGSSGSPPWKDVLVELLPSQGNWSDEQYLTLTDGARRLVEFTDGVLEILPLPTDKHQSIVKFLLYAFDRFVAPLGGKVLFSPLRLQIRPGKYREPDLIVLRSASDPRRQDRYWTGADLVVEVISSDGVERDTVEKRADYAEARVPEYWIVNPENETITVLTLTGGAYAEAGVFRRGDSAASTLLAGFTIMASAVFDA